MTTTLLQYSNSSSVMKIADGGILPDNALEQVKAMVQRQLAKKLHAQELGINIQPGSNNANYDMQKHELNTGIVDENVVAHELGHMQNLQHAPIYRKLLMAAKGINLLSRSAMIPAMLGFRAFSSSPDQRQDLLQVLSAISAASAAPGMMEEASATGNAIANSDNKMETAGALVPALGQHALSSIIPSLLLQLDRHL